MIDKKHTAVVAAIMLIFLGCAAHTATEKELSFPGSVMSLDGQHKIKLEYIQNVKNSLKSYYQVILDIRYYHQQYNFNELATEIEKYIGKYIDDMLLVPETSTSFETRVEIAKIHLLVAAIFFDMGYNNNALKYLESFHDHYHNDRYLLEKSIDPGDVGYSTLGQGFKLLEKRGSSGVAPVLHGKIYPWNKSHGRIYPWRNPDM
jgi:hypothetical protein